MCDIVSHFITPISSAKKKKKSKETRTEGGNVSLLGPSCLLNCVMLDVFFCAAIHRLHLNCPTMQVFSLQL